jgi:23S rRNA pseudouridine2605 synthase
MIRLNKYISDSGYCSRREADDLISSGSVKVNGKVVDVLGTKINRTDKVQIGNETLHSEKLKYLLLNKPKGYITTMDDPQKRNTVLQLIDDACRERLFPVGRLDRKTSGLLLFTNDGELANKLMHPKGNISKVYHVVLDKSLTRADLETIANGIELEDGYIKVDSIAYADPNDKKEIGVEIHSGRNHIVRRIFESLGYTVVKLDRTLYAGLTKKDLPRGSWRFLTQQEVNFLKML